MKLGQRNVNVSNTDNNYVITFEDDKDLSIYGKENEWRLHREESNDQFYNIQVVGEGENKKFSYSNEDREGRMSNISDLYECHQFIIDDVKMIEQLREMIKEIEMSPEMKEQKLKERMSVLIAKMEDLKGKREQIAKQENEIILEKESIVQEMKELKAQTTKGAVADNLSDHSLKKDDKEER